MYESEVFRQEITQLKEMLKDTEKSLNIEGLKEQLVEYQEDMASDGFWDDVERAQRINKLMRSCENRINHYKSLESRLEDTEIMLELSQDEEGDELAEDISKELKQLREEMESLKLTTLLTGKYDSCDCILSLHAGAGGTEAQDWTQMLYRMYTRFGERMGFNVRELDMLDGDEAGIKSVTWEVSGDYAYGFMKSERGVHRLVRISPFDANARRHTSFASLDVAPVIEDEGEIPIEPDDLRIDTYRSSGKGGQHVNRTDSAVRITHLPTGIVVQCQNERSQIQNKETCFRMLRARLAELQEQKRQELMGEVKGELKKIEWGSQIRSYVFQPYTMVKDHRTNYETGNIDDVMDGDLEGFVTAYLQKL
ncbi:MAG: peptide chain release factor 2 [Clostridia bacterium]|jgi:peptide chain release factor 2|nr:peptide chain release factor 2 [Clostridia bacterium]MBR5985400.1 peptide chain release factor 2 [Clostridia bacterium]